MRTNSDTKLMHEKTKTEKWQHFLRRKFQELENSYYPIIDELTQKLADLDGINPKDIPDLDIYQFTFIKEWQKGEVSSQFVLSILQTMQPKNIAQVQLTRRLNNFMRCRNNQSVNDYIIPCRTLIVQNAVPIYEKYLEMLTKYFEKLVEIDASQEKVTWIEQVFKVKEQNKVRAEDINLNHLIRLFNSTVIPYSNTRYYVGDNIICMDEDLGAGSYSVHWLFAPKGYIDELKKLYNIKDCIDLKDEANYIQKLIGVYVNENL